MRLFLAKFIEDIRIALEHERKLPLLLLDFIGRHDLGPVVGNGRGLDDDIAVGKFLEDRFAHLAGRLDAHEAHTNRCGQRRRCGDEYDLGTAVHGLLGDGIAHTAGRTVAKIAYRVQRLNCAASRHEHLFARQRPAFGKKVSQNTNDALRLRQASFARNTASQKAARRLDEMKAACRELAQVALGHGILVHVRIHRRCDKHRGLRR